MQAGGGDMAALTSLRLGMIEDFDADVTPRLLSWSFSLRLSL